ncbi:MAG: hypothetical protein Kow0092_20480 [Deferrisomatales bacterium]
MTAGLRARLAALGDGGPPALFALWAETLGADEALERLADREDPLSRLQRARRLLELGRAGEARGLLQGLAGLPPGLSRLRGELLAAAGGEPASGETGHEASSGLATPTLAELYAAQGDVEAAVATYREVLAREPGNERARGRLRELLGEGPDPLAALEQWLACVRRWREVLGV